VHSGRQRMTATVGMSSCNYPSTNSSTSIASTYADVTITELSVNTNTSDSRVQQASECEIRQL